MKIAFALAAAAALLPARLLADPPSCGKAAAAAYVKLPAMALSCGDDNRLACSADKAAAADKASCAAAGPAYAKVLQRILRPAWWTTPAAEVESCRESKEGALPDEGAGEAIQGSDRVRLLVLGNGCEGGINVYNVLLAVKSDQGVKVKVLELDYYEPRQEAPFSFSVVRNGADTLALYSTSTHDLHEAGTRTTAYKVDLASGNVAEYPLYLTDAGPSSTLTSTEPTVNFDEDESSAQVKDGKLADRFVQYAYVKDCPEDGDCVVSEVVTKRAYTWNGTAFAAGGATATTAPPQADRRQLAAHRQCLKARFDPKTGAADCPGDYAANCESNNDLSFLNYKAGNLDRARDYAAKALEECKGDPRQLAAAQYNDRRARGK